MTGRADAAGRRRRRDGRAHRARSTTAPRSRIERGGAAPATTCAPAGDDLRAGDVVFAPGEVLGAGHLGVLASVGVERGRSCTRRPRVGVLSTGDELVDGRRARCARPDPRLEPRHAAGPASPSTAARPSTSGSSATTRPPSPRPSQDGAATCDAVLTSGGVSHGRLRPREGGARPHRRHALDAGRHPAGQAVRLRRSSASGTPVFGLPGNPVSSLVSFELFARPALRRLAGHPDAARPPVAPAVADEALRRHARRQDPLRPGASPSVGADGRLARALGRRPGLAPAHGHGRGQRPGRRCPTATASTPAATGRRAPARR